MCGGRWRARARSQSGVRYRAAGFVRRCSAGRENGLAPPNALESALVLHLPAGAYTAIVRGADGGTGIALAEVYQLD